MDKSDRDRWLKGFVADLVIGGERVPLERVITARIEGFAALRSEGLTWQAIAALLTRAGARRRDGSLISGDQLRAVVARRLRLPAKIEKSSPQDHSLRRRTPSPPKTSRSTTVRPSGPSKAILNVATGKEVSDDEIAAALASITKKK